jgi:hypothetical protein
MNDCTLQCRFCFKIFKCKSNYRRHVTKIGKPCFFPKNITILDREQLFQTCWKSPFQKKGNRASNLRLATYRDYQEVQKDEKNGIIEDNNMVVKYKSSKMNNIIVEEIIPEKNECNKTVDQITDECSDEKNTDTEETDCGTIIIIEKEEEQGPLSKRLIQKNQEKTKKIDSNYCTPKIQILKFGQENISSLKNINMINMINIIKSNEDGLLKLIEYIHFNDGIPENQNIKMHNIRKHYCKYFDGEYWKLIEENTLIHNVIVSKKDIIDNYYEKLQKKINTDIKKKYKDFSDIFDKIIFENINKKINKDVIYKKIYNKLLLFLIRKSNIDKQSA